MDQKPVDNFRSQDKESSEQEGEEKGKESPNELSQGEGETEQKEEEDKPSQDSGEDSDKFPSPPSIQDGVSEESSFEETTIEFFKRGLPKNLKKPCDCPDVKPEGGGERECRDESKEALLRLAQDVYEVNLEKRSSTFPGIDENGKSWTPKEISVLRKKIMDYYNLVTYPCYGEERIGLWGEGGKWVCRPEELNHKSVVYSIGSQGETSFEEDIFALVGAVTFTFDPSLRSGQQEYMDNLPFLNFNNMGLWNETNKKIRVGSISDIMSALNHTFIDVFKIDCEGCETIVLEIILEALGPYKSGGKVLFGQVLMEFHHLQVPEKTARAYFIMEALGYRLFHVEPNWQCFFCLETAFIHRSLIEGTERLSVPPTPSSPSPV